MMKLLSYLFKSLWLQQTKSSDSNAVHSSTKPLNSAKKVGYKGFPSSRLYNYSSSQKLNHRLVGKKDLVYLGKRFISTSSSYANQFLDLRAGDDNVPVIPYSIPKASSLTEKQIIKEPIKSSQFLTRVLSNLYSYNQRDGFLNNHKTQVEIEKYILREFSDHVGSKNTIIHNIDSTILGGLLHSYIRKHEGDLVTYIKRMPFTVKGSKEFSTEQKDIALDILDKIGVVYLKSLLLTLFMRFLTNRNTDKKEELYLTTVGSRVGKKIAGVYIYKCIYENPVVSSSYSSLLSEWKQQNSEVAVLLENDSFLATLGCKIVEILFATGMAERKLEVMTRNEQHWVVDIGDKTLLSKLDGRKVFVIPTKLPMIVEPKKYTKTELGGYLLNDIAFSESVFIHKSGYEIKTELHENNLVIDTVNNISCTPFKINEQLLDYLSTKNGSNLLLDPRKIHDLELLKKRTKRQETELRSYKSKILLQEMVLEIVNFYRNFNKIYFPVRLDQRGRLYCTPNYFNYQSDDLSKALLLFSKPGVILRGDEQGIMYLKVYGASSYGGSLSKKSVVFKSDWVDKNEYDIVNFENNKLLEKAKDKLLFLAFCIEYKRYIDFLSNEKLTSFNSYLPIQLDATCNGFQHMALLSSETMLYGELNLRSEKENTLLGDENENKLINQDPKDFYNFLLHKLVHDFQDKVDKGIIYADNGGSYERLNNFIWDRSHLKKTIMTIPYNASTKSMAGYILDNLKVIDEKAKGSWYSDTTGRKKIESKDVYLLVKCINEIIVNDFARINKLTKYLKNIALLFNKLNLPITWNLPSGLKIIQSYQKTITTVITPFSFSKSSITLKSSLPGTLDHNKQKRSLMPNLIHSLDAASMNKLYSLFYRSYPEVQFYSIHDCFATTTEKAATLKIILASVYTELYSNESYLLKFDRDIINLIKDKTDYKLEGRKLYIDDCKPFKIHDIDWVLSRKFVVEKDLQQIDAHHILV